MPQLQAHQMELGDVLLLKDMGEASHVVIGMAQAVLSHGWNRSSNVTHAGLYGAGNKILEASGSGHGLQAMGFGQKAAHYHFEVYRLTGHADTARQAAYWAEILIGQRNDAAGFGGYSKPGATSSLFRSSTVGPGATQAIANLKAAALQDDFVTILQNRAFYCSAFVVECYVLASADNAAWNPINLDFRYVSPKRLEGELRKAGSGWNHEGFIIAGQI